jgi:hypothetical protein
MVDIICRSGFKNNILVSADARSPYGEFAKRQGIIHFTFSEFRKLSNEYIMDTPDLVKNDFCEGDMS